MKTRRSKFNKFINNFPIRTVLGDISHTLSPERLGAKISERVFWRASTDEPKIALTFDDGPDELSTPRILKLLAKFKVAATFFLIGKHLEKHVAVAQHIVDAGHEIGNHSFSHIPLLLLTDRQIKREIVRTDDLLRSLFRVKPYFLRPPSGLFTTRVVDIAENLGYKVVVGDVYPRDPHLPGKEKIVNRVLRRTSPGSIIILHDGGNSRAADRSQTIEALKEIIPRLKMKSYEFVALSDLLLSKKRE